MNFRKLGSTLLLMAMMILLLEVSSVLILQFVISPSRRARFDGLFFSSLESYSVLPHPFLGFVGQTYAQTRDRLLTDVTVGKDSRAIYIATKGGSTTADGWPEHMQTILEDELAEINRSVVLYNFGTPGWTSLQSFQNYYLLVKDLPPDIVVVHHNINDHRTFGTSCSWSWWGDDAVIAYPQIHPLERALLVHSRFLRLAKHTTLAFGTRAGAIGTATLRNPRTDVDKRIAAYVNQGAPDALLMAAHYFWIDYVNATCNKKYWEKMGRLKLRRNYEDFIDFARMRHTTVILTTQYLNYSKRFPVITDPRLQEVATQDEEGHRDINQMLRDIAEEKGVSLVDLDYEMRPLDSYLKEDGEHWKQEGVEKKGEIIGRYILNHVL